MTLVPSGVEWEQLLRHLDLADEFNLIFLICPSAQHAEAAREACADHLREHGGVMDYLMPFGAEEIRHLARLLLTPAQERAGEVLWVSLYPDPNILSGSDGLKELKKWTSAMSHGLATLNQARNQFARCQGRPVILAGTSQLLDICPIVAPDLWSIRRGVIRLPASSTALSGTGNVFTGSEIRSAKEGTRAIEPPAASLADAERALAAAAKVRGKPEAKIDLLRYLLRAATALEGRGHVEDLRRVLDEALEIAQQMGLPERSVEFSTLLNNLALLLAETNRLAEAEPLYRRGLEIDERSFGPDHPKVAVGLNNLALLLADTNRLAEAEPLFRRALEIGEVSFGPDHPNVATRLNNLASLLADTNRLAEAELLYRRALEIDERSFGPDHPTVAIRLNNLALLLADTNRLAEAEPLYRRALEIDERSFGPDHPEVATDLNNLASLLKETNRLAEAEPLFGRAVRILLEFQFKNHHKHPRIDSVIRSYSNLLKQMGRSEEEIEEELEKAREEATRTAQGVQK